METFKMERMSKHEIFDYLNKELNRNNAEVLKKHIDECIKCKKKYDSMCDKITMIHTHLDTLEPSVETKLLVSKRIRNTIRKVK